MSRRAGCCSLPGTTASAPFPRRRTSPTSSFSMPEGPHMNQNHRLPAAATAPPPAHPDRTGRRRPRRLLAPVPRPAAAAAGVRPLRHRPLRGARRRGGRRRLHLRRAGSGRGRREAARRRLRPDRRLPDHLPDRVHGAADRPAGQDPGAADRPAAHRGDGPRQLRHRPVAGLLRPVPGARGRPTSSAGPASSSAPSPATSRTSAPGAGSAAGCAPPASGPPAPRPARADGPPLPGHAGRLHRPHHWSPTHLRLPRRGAGVRRPAGTGRAGHRRRGRRAHRRWPGQIFTLDDSRQRRRLRLGRAGLGRPGPAGRGLRPGLARLLPPRPRRRAARTARRRDDPRRPPCSRPAASRWPASTSCAPPSPC